jgi:hypothetical protein
VLLSARLRAVLPATSRAVNSSDTPPARQLIHHTPAGVQRWMRPDCIQPRSPVSSRIAARF